MTEADFRAAEFDRLFRPPGLSAEESGLRRMAFDAWRESAGEFRAALGVLADWLDEHDHPGGWWRWRVACPAATTWDIRQAYLRGVKHNGRFWLCWSAGWVRVTGGYLLKDGYAPVHMPPAGVWRWYHPDAWSVSIQPHQTKYSVPAERRLPLGWTTLFHPPGRCPLSPAEREHRSRPEPADSLFAGLEG